MIISSILRSIDEILAGVPWVHWLVMGLLTLGVVALVLGRRRASVYGAVALGIAVFAALLFLETTVVVRWCGVVPHETGVHLDFDFKRLWHVLSLGYESLFNIVAFVPFGFFLAQYLSTKRRDGSRLAGPWRSMALATLAALGLSLSIECLQLALHVGFFELTDLVMNTLGGFAGALLSLIISFINFDS